MYCFCDILQHNLHFFFFARLPYVQGHMRISAFPLFAVTQPELRVHDFSIRHALASTKPWAVAKAYLALLYLAAALLAHHRILIAPILLGTFESVNQSGQDKTPRDHLLGAHVPESLVEYIRHLGKAER